MNVKRIDIHKHPKKKEGNGRIGVVRFCGAGFRESTTMVVGFGERWKKQGKNTNLLSSGVTRNF